MSGLRHFERPQHLIDWGIAALAEAKRAMDSFVNDRNFRFFAEYDPELGQTVEKVRLVSSVPPEIPRKLTEALNNARNSFDQSLFAACAAIGKPVKDAHYPWSTDPDPDLKHRFVHKRTGRVLILPEFWDVIRAQEPYGRGEGYSGGDDLVREVAKLANRKHTIGVSIAAEVGSVEVPGFALTQMGGNISLMVPKWDPVKNEIILARVAGRVTNRQPNYRIGFHVTFDVKPPLGEIPANFALRAFLNKAQSALNGFRARAAELGAS